jgi:transposase
MRAYSVDLRQRVLTALDRGMARQQVVVTFGVSLATLKRWLVLRRTATALTPKTPSGRCRTIPVAQHAALWAQLEAHPDATLAQHTQMWNTTHGVTLSYRTLGRAITRLGWTRKKRRWQPPNAMSRPASPTVRE